MKWQKAQFKGKQVWVAVVDTGTLDVEGGRVPMRYSSSEGAKIYRAAAANVVLDSESEVQTLSEGKSADKTSATQGRGFGKAGTRTKQQKALAAEAARELLDGLGNEVVRCFTDGGCKGNPGPAGSGVYMVWPDGRVLEAAESLGTATNNIGELRAIEIALEVLDEAGVDEHVPVAILTDSSYANGVLCLGWKAKANRSLILGIRERLTRRPAVTLYWVAGHVGVEGNERADALAGQGILGETFRTWL